MNRACMTLAAFAAAGMLLSALPVRGQDDIRKKQAQLQQLRKDIDRYEGRIREQEKKEHATLELLDTYDRQAVLLRTLIKRLHDQGEALQVGIDSTKRSVDRLDGQVSFLRNHYARYVTAAYKFGRSYDLDLLLSSNSVNQFLIRAEYLRRFSEQRKHDLLRLDTEKDELESQSALLQKQLDEQKDLLSDKQREEATLARKMKKRKVLLADIRRDKNNFRKEISRKTQSAKDMEQLIARLIEADRARKEREKDLARDRKGPSNESPSASPLSRGRLLWPVAQGKIAARFGNQQHPTLHTVTQNTGIDIAVPAGTEVRAAADGEVGVISWLPSYGNLVILNHANGVRTVYAHLSEISVSEGDKIKEGEHIGKSGESVAGSLLHFEVYKDREKQDPEHWLRPRALTQRTPLP